MTNSVSAIDALEAFLLAPDSEREALVALIRRVKSRPRGGESLKQKSRRELRNAMLVKLWQTGPWAMLSPAHAAAKIEAANRQYLARSWSRQRDYISPPPAEPAATLWQLHQNELHVPKKRTIAQALRDAEQSTV